MLNLSKNIRYCYLGNKSKAYIITSSVDNSKEILKSKIYTEPYKMDKNVILGYSNKILCENKIKHLEMKEVNMNLTDIMYLKSISHRLNLSLLVIANVYCDINTFEEYDEIFFYIHRQDDEYIKEFQNIINK